jgi:hypothetical protein
MVILEKRPTYLQPSACLCQNKHSLHVNRMIMYIYTCMYGDTIARYLIILLSLA